MIWFAESTCRTPRAHKHTHTHTLTQYTYELCNSWETVNKILCPKKAKQICWVGLSFCWSRKWSAGIVQSTRETPRKALPYLYACECVTYVLCVLCGIFVCNRYLYVLFVGYRPRTELRSWMEKKERKEKTNIDIIVTNCDFWWFAHRFPLFGFLISTLEFIARTAS